MILSIIIIAVLTISSLVIVPFSLSLIRMSRDYILGSILFTLSISYIFTITLSYSRDFITGKYKEYRGSRKNKKQGAAILSTFLINPMIVFSTIFVLWSTLIPGDLFLFIFLLTWFFFIPGFLNYYLNK